MQLYELRHEEKVVQSTTEYHQFEAHWRDLGYV